MLARYISVSILITFLIPQVFARDSITSFDTSITIQKDTSIAVSESISYSTDQQKHGIYRYVPRRYTRNGTNYTANVDLDSILDEEGRPYTYSESSDRDNITWKIGDPDKTFTGQKIYSIAYSIWNIVQQYEDHDELYIDITGEGWLVDIDTTTANIQSPFAKIEKVACFSGSFGTNNQQCRIRTISDNSVVISYDKPIAYGDNLTVAVWLDPNNQLQFPSSQEKLSKLFFDNLWLVLVPFPLLVMFLTWYTKGRDIEFISPNVFDMDDKPTRMIPLFASKRSAMVYQPLRELTPGEAGFILDEKVDNRDIIAEIIDLARKKYLTIEPIEKKNFVFRSQDYLFKKLKDPTDADLPKHQKYLHEKLFKSAESIKLSTLKGTFYTEMSKIRTMIHQSAMEKELFTRTPSQTAVGFGFMFGSSVTIPLLFSSQILNPGLTLPFILFIPQYILVPFFSKAMIQKTAKGTNWSRQARGLKQTITVGSWRQKIHEKNMFFEEVLPFAIAFSIVDKISKDMDDLGIGAPEYLASSGWQTQNFARSFSQFESASMKDLTYNPSSSSSSGGSGFSGGSSGGGFGGGGGGSW